MADDNAAWLRKTEAEVEKLTDAEFRTFIQSLTDTQISLLTGSTKVVQRAKTLAASN